MGDWVDMYRCIKLQALAKALEALGFLCLHADHCCFTNADRDVFVLVFVDDIQITGPNISAVETLHDGLKATFTLKELEAQTFLGLQIERDQTKRRLRLRQKPSTKILQDFGFRSSKPVATPMLEQNLVPHGGPVDLGRQRWYRQAVRSLNHLAVSTRPDLVFSMS
jgi:Reverse transcriptase (RNA-dependent DNA polymerase)